MNPLCKLHNVKLRVLTRLSRLQAHAGIYRLLMKRIFGDYILRPFDKKMFFELLTRVNTCDFTVSQIVTVKTF